MFGLAGLAQDPKHFVMVSTHAGKSTMLRF